MKRLYLFIALSYAVTLNAQIAPILDHTWTIDQIDTGTQIITADLNPFGEYDTFTLNPNGAVLDNITFYQLVEIIFGHCEGYYSFNDNDSTLLYHWQGCLLSNDDSSQIALYFNYNFIQQNTNLITIDNDFFPDAYGPLSYSFTTVGDIVYMDITNSIGEVARFWANNLSTDSFLEQAVSVYPNPVSDVVNINTIEGVEIQSTSIYDLYGRKELGKQFVESQLLNVSELVSGVYILEVVTDKGILTKKMVKK
mgnify:CR=1 FL=1